MQIVVLDGSRMKDRRSTHLYLAQTLRFPAYYGRNLDALYDCLTEFCGDMLIILQHAPSMLSLLGQYGEDLLQVFQNAAESGCTRFFVDPT